MKKLALLVHVLCTFFLSVICSHAYAARPLVTDDARLTQAHSCQLESWTRAYTSGHELWAMPACNLDENLEITLGVGSYYNQAARYQTMDWIAQIKTLFKLLSDDGWGWGLAVGRVMHPDIQPGPNQLGNTYFYIPVSIAFDHAVLHLNIGMQHDNQQNINKSTFGLGSEFKLGPRVLGIAELYGDQTQSPYLQMGMRYAISPDVFQMDTTIGQQMNGGHQSQWLSIGIRWTPSP